MNGFVRFTTSLNEIGNDLIFISVLKLRYTHSIWFDEGLRKLDDYNQEFFVVQLSLGFAYNFSD